MNDNRLGAVALILGATFGILTAMFHPAGGPHHVTPAQFETLIAVIVGVHALAIASLPISFAGALALTRRIDSPNRVALVGLIVYGFGLLALMAAATMSGLVTPAILRQIVAHTGPGDQWHTLMSYTHSINQGFAKIGAIASCVAIALWSALIVQRRVLSTGLGIYGLLSALAITIAIVSGVLNLELHGFILITLTQAIWFVLAGVFLWRSGDSQSPA